MKTSLSVCVLAALALSLPAAAQQTKGESSRPGDSKASASKDGKDAGKGAMSKAEATMLHDMMEADLAEVEVGKVAASKASNDRVKQFAQHMIEAHGKGLKEGMATAGSQGVQAPSSPNKKHQDAAKKLESLSGAAFDKAYMNQMVSDHQETLNLVQKAAKSQNADVRAAGEKKVPVVQEHLKMAREVLASLDAKGADKKSAK